MKRELVAKWLDSKYSEKGLTRGSSIVTILFAGAGGSNRGVVS